MGGAKSTGKRKMSDRDSAYNGTLVKRQKISETEDKIILKEEEKKEEEVPKGRKSARLAGAQIKSFLDSEK